MAKASFDPLALVRYIERVQLPTASATKNFSALRIAIDASPACDPSIETLRNANYATPTEEVAVVQQELRRLTERPARSEVPPTLKRSGSK